MKSLRIHISDDQYTASVTILSDPDHFPSEEEILKELKKKGVVYGIDRNRIKHIVERKRSVAMETVAAGRYPNGRLEWKFNIATSRKPFITSQNRADFKNIEHFNYVHKDEDVAIYRDTSAVEPGVLVTGKTVEPAGIYNKLPDSSDFYLDKDGRTLRAARDGYLLRENGHIQISDVFYVKGDVGYNTGNIKTDGPIVIDGDVRSGFRVESNSTIMINGTVDAASIYTSHGDIIIRDGILGKGRAKILCGGRLTCGFAQDAHISAQKDVILHHYALNCVITSGGYVRLSDKKGVVRGGTITADKGIYAHEAGTERGSVMDLVIRNYAEPEGSGMLWKLGRKRIELHKRISSMKKRLEFLEVLKKNKSTLSRERLAEMDKIRDEIKRLMEKRNALNEKEFELIQNNTRKRPVKEIQITGNLYRNVHIDMGGIHYSTTADLSGVRLYRLKDEIVIESLDENSASYDVFVPERSGERGPV